MQTIRQWLDQLGLSQYAEVFTENDVDLEALRLLTEGDLEKLGVSLGNRKKLLTAIARLDGHAPPAGAADRSPHAPSHHAEAERRQLTVLFCDLVGSTALSQRLDPEELRDLMQAYQRACGDVIERYESHVAQYLGDGLMVYFGWPRAHEDDAVRAIRAGLEVVDAVSKLKAATPIRARVGIHTGLVVVGETGQGDASIPKAAVGATPNIAARLQSLAEPSSVVVSERTRSLAVGLFDYADLGAHSLKGVSEAVHLFRVMSGRVIESRFEAAHGGVALTPLVGREEEVALLLRRWQQARNGEGQVVLVSGEPGIGKSRLTQVLREHIAGEPYTALRYQCSPHHVNSALYPVIQQFQFAAGFTREDSPERKLDRMQSMLVGSEEQIAEAAPLFAALLSLPMERYSPLAFSAQKQKEKTLEALAAQLEALGRRRPVLMVFEDVHWIDPTSQESLDVLLPRLQSLPILLVITYRTEYTPHWTEQAHVTTLGLSRLGRRLGAELVAKVTGGKALPQAVLDQILAHTDGVPLFIEELTKSVLESKLLRQAGTQYVLDGPLPALAIPTTLHDSLIARLDRLAPVKEIAQIGACIGREFSYDLLAAVSPLKGERLEEALEQLTKTGLVFRRGTPPDATYTFKHALVQDAAYNSLLKSRRTELHAAIAAKLEGGFPQIASTQPEILAHHFTHAGLIRPAIDYWLKAGQHAAQRLAYAEAIAYYQRGIELLRFLPNTREVAGLELNLQLGLGYAYLPLKGWTAPESLQAFTRAQALCKQAGESESIFSALRGLWNFHAVRGEARVGLNIAEECFTVAQAAQSTDTLLQAHLVRAWSLQCVGDLRAARKHYEEIIALYDPVAHRLQRYVYGQDPKLVALGWLPVVLEALGYPDQALTRCAEAEVAARVVAHPFSQCFAFHAGFFIHNLRGEVDRARAFAEALLDLAKDQRFPHWEIVGGVYQNVAVLHSGRGEGTEVRELKSAIAALLAMGAGEPALRCRALLAQGLACLPDIDGGLQECEEGLRLVLQRGQREFEAIFLRVQGDLLLMQDTDLDLAAESYRKAIEVARGQHARSHELRAALGLARLHCKQREYENARTVLASVYGWFTEGFDTKDLKEATALLDQLS